MRVNTHAHKKITQDYNLQFVIAAQLMVFHLQFVDDWILQLLHTRSLIEIRLLCKIINIDDI